MFKYEKRCVEPASNACIEYKVCYVNHNIDVREEDQRQIADNTHAEDHSERREVHQILH